MGTRRSIELNHVPKIGFKYGNEEYVAIVERSLVVGDEVAWSLPNGTRLAAENEQPLIGIVEFVGCKTLATENEPPEVKAVVQFTQSTCHLPGHITNPPCNRNLIQASQLTRMGDGQWELNTNQSYSVPFMKMSIQLIGNCMVMQQSMTKLTIDEFPQGEPILVKTESQEIAGKVMTVGDIQVNNGTIRCVGVKFEKSLEICFPFIEIAHVNNIPSDRCKQCIGGTLAFLPMKLLSYSKKTGLSNSVDRDDNHNNQITEMPKTPQTPARTRQPLERARSIPPTQQLQQSQRTVVEPETVSEPPMPVIKDTRDSVSTPTIPSPKKRLTCSFVGNCVAKKKGIEEIGVKGITKDGKISARNQRNLINGVVVVTCTIAGLQTGYTSYVGVKFNKSFADLCVSENVIMHCDLQGKNPNSCKICAGGKLVFIPTDFFQAGTECAGVTFNVVL